MRIHKLPAGYDLIISIIGGFVSSFTALSLLPYLHLGNGFAGQLIAGDPAANRELPTTLNMMHAAMDGTNPMTANLTSFGWWIAVTIGTIVCTAILLKLIRRVV